MPFLLEVALARLAGEMLADVVRRKGAAAGSLDGPVSWFDGRARILSWVEDTGFGRRFCLMLFLPD